MARIGKIARLPGDIRAQLNSRLQDGGEGRQIVHWLNSLPEVKEVLAENFDGHPISEQNLSDWRQGGYEEWLARQDILAQAAELADHRQELETVAPGQSPADHLAAAISFRYGAILAAQGLELDEKSLTQLKALGRLCQAVVKLRRGDHNAARLKIETERWELVRLQMAADTVEEVQRKQREALAAPIWAAIKRGERVAQYGGGKAIQFAMEYLYEVETCKDPAHFKSKVLAALDPEEWARYGEELAKNPPVKRSPIQAAADMLHEMDVALGLDKTKDRAASAQRKPCRRARKPASCRPAKRATTRPVQPAETVPPNDPAPPAPAPAPPSDSSPMPPASGAPDLVASSLRLDPGLSTQPSAGKTEHPIKPDKA
jgi:hypothetical protein